MCGCLPVFRGGTLASYERMKHFAFALLVTVLVPARASAQQHTLREQVLTMGVTEEVVVSAHPQLGPREMAAAAGAVVRVAVRNHDTFLSADGATMLTDYRAAVTEVIKDAARAVAVGDVITIRRVGGVMQIDGRKVFSNEAGFPPFADGAEYVLFLKDGGQPYELVAGAASAFRVEKGLVAPVADDAAPVLMPAFVQELKEPARPRQASQR